MVDVMLPLIFLFTSFLYSSVGLGGGSSYTALLTIAGVSYKLIPTTSLSLNLIVSSLGMFNFWRNGHVKLDIVLPFLFTSIPMAYFASGVAISEHTFHLILLTSLLIIASRIYLLNNLRISIQLEPLQKWVVAIFIGSLLGFIAGSVGIGGGIYLVPILIILGFASEKEAAAAGAVFIWVNSLSGLAARIPSQYIDLKIFFPLIGSVLIGGYLGSHFGSFRFDVKYIQKSLGLVIIIAIILLVKELI